MLKKKKSIYLLLIGLALIAGFQSCDEKELTLEQTSQRFVVSSEQSVGNLVEVGDTVSLADISPGVVSRQWSVNEGEVILKPSDNNNTTSSLDNILAIFPKIGEYNVNLNQVFETDAYVGSRLAGKELDTIIAFRVIGEVNTIITARRINFDGTLGDWLTMENDAENEVEAGSTVKFYAESTGEPNTYTWSFEGGDPETSSDFVEEIDVKYRRIDTYGFGFFSGRRRPQGSFFDAYSNLIKIVPSTQPLLLDGITAGPDGIMELNFSREIDEATIDIADFSVSITNGETAIPNTIASITTKPDAANVLILTLDGDRVYNDDTVTVSYTAGSLTTTDFKLADDYIDVPVVFVGDNILASDAANYDHSLENSTFGDWPFGGWEDPWGDYNRDDSFISTEQAYDGEKSIKIVMDPNGGAIFSYTGGSFPIEDGKSYEVGYWIYVEKADAPDPGGLVPDIRFYWFPNVNWGVPPRPGIDAAFPRNEWVYVSSVIDFGGAGDYNFSIRGANGGNSTETIIYLDNISVTEAVLRP
ncbi:hypothetical protein MHTCC0001_01950 [Flavobacteriaceae bacterium MHTCC 0001]